MDEETIIEEDIQNVRVPRFFKKRYLEQVDDFDSPITVLKALRVNTLLIGEKELVKRLTKKGVKLTKIDFLDFGYEYESNFSLSSTLEYLKGFFYIQEGASQIPIQVLAPKPGDIILDMSAAPGGKTTQISQYMNNEGVVVALDNVNKRIESLENNIERLGCVNVVVYNKDARFVGDLNIQFDKVLLDAPCSGNYCVENDWFTKRSIEDINNKSGIQKQLLSESIKVLKKGGILVYSTCSLEREEDEDVVEWVLNNFDVKILDTGLKIGSPGCTDKTKLSKKFWPHKTGTQGFFLAKFKKI